jgi:hypothetical protein
MSGCVASSSQTITVFPRPNTTITSLRQTRFCLGDSAVLQAPAGFAQVRWSDGTRRDIARGQTLVTRLSGNYSAELLDNNGCTWTSNTITLRALSFAKQLFVLSTQTEFTLDTTGLNRLTCASITLFNADSVRSVVMQNIPLLRNIEFSLPPSLLPFVLPPGTRRTLTVCFSPRDIGTRRDTMFVEDSCGVTPIALFGEGVSNNYAGNSRCDARVILRSLGESGLATNKLAVMRLAQPSPNPASNGVSLLVERFVESQTGVALDAKCFVKDILGNTLAEADYSSLERFSESSGKEIFEFERGTFTVNISRLQSGAYMLVVQTSQGATAFPIIVQK